MKIIKERSELTGMLNSKLGMRKQKRIPLPEASTMGKDRENLDLLEECRRYWDSLRDFRERRLRSRRYHRGEQWSDLIVDPDSASSTSPEYISEETYLMNQGKVPLKQNLVRKNIRNLIGQYLSNPSKTMVLSRIRENAEVTEMFTNALQAALQNNNSKLLDISSFRESTLSGAIGQKISYQYWRERNLEDVLIDNVNPARLFFNTDLSDPRLLDLRLVGEIIDTTIDDIVSTFAKSTVDEKRIRDLYAGLVDRASLGLDGLDPSIIDNLDFYIPRDVKSARMFEVWQLKGEWRIYAHDPIDGSYNIVPYTLKEVAAQNQERITMGAEQGIPEEEIPLIEAEEKYEQFWYVKFLTPFGQCLFESETPYKHEGHPYVLSLQPMIDGEVWGLVEDMIDQQRYINRLIIQMDFIISASAKGVLMVPEDVLPDGWTPDRFAKEWTRFNGVIFYKPNVQHGKMPQQISANSTNVGIHEMLALQMNLFQDVSGIHNAIQGKEANSGTPASLYAQQAQNATINTLEQMTYFENFLQNRDRKVLKVITQFYDDKRYLAVNGKSINEQSRIYDPELARNVDFDVVVTQGTDTPVYRQLIDDTLLQLLQGNLIDLEMYLEQTSLPFADKLLQAVKQRTQMAQQGQIPGALPPELVGEVNQSANPKAMALLNQAMGPK
jgi:hypothetical protein